jgi:SAM-dependent methyltransferase
VSTDVGTSDFVSSDGSPLAMYLALPAGEEPLVVHRAITPEASILELGSGPGRVTRVLVALGHEVVAVDDSPEMLAHVTGATTVCADVYDAGLDLGRRFDTVLAGSHLVNEPDETRRAALWAVCRRHVDDDGVVLVQRYPPGWLLHAGAARSAHGPVETSFEPGRLDGAVRSATVTYRLDNRSWAQSFDAIDVGDDLLATDAGAVGLVIDRMVTDDGTWVALRPSSP